MPDVDVIVVPVGGAGLIAGIALASKTLQPEVKVRREVNAVMAKRLILFLHSAK